MPAESRSLKEVFLAALAVAPAERAAWLEQTCGQDVELRQRVDLMLAAHDTPQSLLDRPAFVADRPDAVTGACTGAEAERPGAVIGPYKLLQQIGEGGMGVVWMAEQTHPVQRKVAIKVIKPGMDSRQVIARFEAERQALAMMDHVNIARVFDAGATEAGRPYFVMELVHGVPITKYCDDNHLTPRQRLELFVPVCQAIQHAHQKGIIHRDIKPSNVMITLYDGKPVPKVIDFGVAKATEQKLTERTLFTQYGTMVGTLEYMSPEQAEMSALGVDTRSDIYSLGVMLYELLTGSTPLSHKRVKEAAFAEILRMIKEEEPQKPSTRLSDSGEALASISAQRQTEPAKLAKLVRGELDWIVMKCLEKDRNRRYETANGFAADVQRYLSDEPVQACPPSAGYRLRKFARRNKRPVLAVAVILLALVGGVIGTTWGMVRAELARGLAEDERDEKDKARQLAETNEERALKARDAERLALAGEVKQRQRAEANAKLATAVLDEIILKEARQRLTLYTQDQAKGVIKSPEREKLEWEFLEKGLKFYEQLAQTNATDWTARRERAKAYANVGLVRLELKNYVESEKAFRQAIQLTEELAAERPLDFDSRYDLANNYHWLYRPCYDSRQFAAAEAATRQALVLFEKLAADFPDRSPFVPEQIAYIHGNRGRALDARGRPEEAATAFRQSVVLYEKLAAEFPDRSPLYLEHKANAHRSLGQLLVKSAKPQEAEQAFQKSIALWSELATAHPKAAGYRYALAYDYHSLAKLHTSQKRFADADTAYKRATTILEKLVAEFDLPEFRSLLGGTLLNWAFTCKADGQLKEAEQIFRQAAIVFEAWQTNWPTESRWAIHELGYIYLFLGQLLSGLGGREEDAEKAYRQSVAYHEKQLTQDPEKAEYQERLTWSYAGLARHLRKTKRPVEASQLEAKRLDLVKKLASTATLASEMNSLAWNLATDPDPDSQRGPLAVELAKKAIELAPTEGSYWKTLGTAHYRAGSWQAAIKALRKASELNQGRFFSHDAFFLAMAHWQLGEKEQARKWYAPALVWMEKHAPKNEELLRFRAEAAFLLGLPEKLTPEQEPAKGDDVKLYTLVLEADTKAAWAYGARGSAYAERGEWKEAAAEFARAAELNPGYPFHQYRQALVRIQLGDVAGYRTLCADMLVRFDPAAKADSAHWVVWTCALAADAVADWKIPMQLAEKAVADNPKNYRALNQQGAVLYRASQYQESLKRLTEAEAVYRPDDAKLSAIAYNWLFLAMAHHRLGHVEEAQKWRDKATQWIDKEMQRKPNDPAAASPLTWNRRLTVQLLRREAEKLLK